MGQKPMKRYGKPAGPLQLTSLQILDGFEDLVRVIGPEGSVYFENEKMRSFARFAEVDSSARIFPVSTAGTTFSMDDTSTTELCYGGHVFSVKSSPIRKDDQVIAVAEVFRDITIQNNVSVELYAAFRKMKQEMRLARSIQEHMLSSLRSYGALQFDFRYIPSEELSGDFFDMIPLGRGRIGVYISDIVGHGVSASIITMFIRQTMRSILEEEHIFEPAEVLTELRTRFTQVSLEDHQYFSIFYGVFDTLNNHFTYANAGHNCSPVVVTGDRVECIEMKGMLISPVFPDYEYHQETRDLLPGQRFLFFTDGSVETLNSRGESYGMENLLSMIREKRENLLDAVIRDVEQFRTGRQKDDIAFLYVENLDS